MSFLKDQLLCGTKSDSQKMARLLDVAPQVVREGTHFDTETKNYRMRGVYRLDYPDDFRATKYSSEDSDVYSLMIAQKIVAKNPFTLSASVYFEMNLSDWSTTLYNIPDGDNSSN
jgi:hypothetical protein